MVVRIQICGSMTFAKEMKSTKKQLEELGHIVTIPTNTDEHVKDPSFAENLLENFTQGVRDDIIKANFDLVAAADAILVLNHPKNGINGYLGTSTLMEIGLAHYLGKKIFLLHKIPHYDEIRWAHEVMMINPTTIEGDLAKIK